MQITVKKETPFGTARFYPVCDRAKLFCKLTRHTTLTQGDIDDIKKLGYDVKKEAEPEERI